MECKYVRECQCLAFVFHPRTSSLFYLTNSKNRLRIVEENLYTGLVMNQFSVPLKQQNLNVDNYILNFNEDTKQIILTLSNHILAYSLEMKVLTLVGEVQGKNPYFIQKCVTRKSILYFSASEQHNIYGVNLEQAIKTPSITNYIKFKLPPQVSVIDLATYNNKLVALCSDFNLRVWDIDSTNALRGAAIQKIGEPCCMAFSKNGEELLIGTKGGFIQVWDGQSLGTHNTLVLNKQLSKQRIQSLSWFHYSGQAQSKRFLVLTEDRNVKLYSLYFEKLKDQKDKYMGKTNQLSLLYVNQVQIGREFAIKSHQSANFIYFHPGVLLYMIDYYPRIYYPVITKQITHSFESLLPNQKKQIAWQSDFFYIDNLIVKRLRNQVENKLSLSSVLEYEDLKILKMDYRPKVNDVSQLSIYQKQGELNGKLKYKFMITYYMGTMIRSLLLSNICLSSSNEAVETFKEYSGHSVIFLGPNRNINPLILILQEDKQTITVLSESAAENTSGYDPEEIRYMKISGEIYTRQLKIKIQRIFETPFRNSYVLIYQSDNILRFSNNIHLNSELIDYEVYGNCQLRLDYHEIVIDILWTSRGEIGCVLCLQKVIFINEELKIIKSKHVEGNIIQGQFLGYTLIVTTKVDVQYIDVSCQPIQLYCIQNYESKYLILGVMVDRIIGIEKVNNAVTCKCRYFNLMEPLLAGYLNYYSLANVPINQQQLIRIIESFAPYNLVSEQFLKLLNKFKLTFISKYFIESHVKMYSRTIRYQTLNSEIHVERFISQSTWLKNKNKILDLLLYIEDLKDSHDQYDQEKCKQDQKKLISLIGHSSFDSIKNAQADEHSKSKVQIGNSFGQKSLFQIYWEYNEKDNKFIKMEIEPFKAQNIGEWVGLFPIYIQSKVGDNEIEVNIEQKQEQNPDEEDNGGEFRDLLVFYRCDDGKGEVIDDLSDFANEGMLESAYHEPWMSLEEDPMENVDKWGKKCPPQFALVNSSIVRQKKVNGRAIKSFSFQIWLYSSTESFQILKIGESLMIEVRKNSFVLVSEGKQHPIKYLNEEVRFTQELWSQITLNFDETKGELSLFLNSQLAGQTKCNLKIHKDSLRVCTTNFVGWFTEFRLWRKTLTPDQIKDNLRIPLEIVAEKRKMKRVKIKEKKKAPAPSPTGDQQDLFPSFPF